MRKRIKAFTDALAGVVATLVSLWTFQPGILDLNKYTDRQNT